MMRSRPLIGVLVIAVIALSAVSYSLYVDLGKLTKRYESLSQQNITLSRELDDLRSRFSALQSTYGSLANASSRTGEEPFKKQWSLVARNVTLRHEDTLRLTIEINDDWYWGVRALDRLEVSFVNVYSKDLPKNRLGTGEIMVFVDGYLFSARPIIFPSDPRFYQVPFQPVSPNESTVREFPVSYHFFFENWNYIHVGKPAMTIEFVYRGTPVGGRNPTLRFAELELYVVGTIRIQAYLFPSTNFNAIATRLQCIIIGPDKQIVQESCGV